MEGVVFVLGIIVGSILFYVFCDRKKPSGTFIIDVSDPTKDVCRIEMYDSLNNIWYKDRITLNIKTIGDISQE